MASVKNKIRTGTLFLFVLLLMAGGVGIYYLVQLKQVSKVILKNNYESLEYCHTMQSALDSFFVHPQKSLAVFETALRQQEANTTEPGEKEGTHAIRVNFNKLKSADTTLSIMAGIRNQLQHILHLNMAAIEAKNKISEKTAEKALGYLSMMAALIFIVALSFSYNFPSVLTNPINELTIGIQEIAAKNYGHRIHIDRKDEFGKMSDAFNTMAERLEYYASSNLSKLMFEKKRAEAVINSLKDASIGIDKSNTVLFANNQALQLLSLQTDDIVGKTADEVSSKNDLFRFLLDEKNTTLFKVVVNDKENYFTKETLELSDETGGNKVIVLKNITSFKELDTAKTNFIATISHELKTPLASSDFGLKLLDDERTGALSTGQKELIQHLKDDNKRMLKILSELLNISQVETGHIQLHRQMANAATIADAAIAAVISAAKEKNIGIQTQIADDLPPVLADIEKTGWVLINFLTNAIKHSPDNSVIDLSIKSLNGKVVFVVTDNGSGIAEEHLPKIFDRYFKVPGSKKEGMGLGLAISKEFIEAMGGKIWVKSTFGMGSEFGFEL